VDFVGSKGQIRLIHPDLLIEFLVPEKGRGSDKPFPLPQLGVNAQPLRMLNFLTDNLIHLKVEGITITLPHPANFALHKLIIFQRRLKEDKAIKDRNTAIEILKVMINKGESKIIRQVFDSAPKKWQLKIIQGLSEPMDKDILSILST